MLKYFLMFLVIVAAVHSSISVPIDADNDEPIEGDNGKVSIANFTVLELPEMQESRLAPTGRPTRLIASNYRVTWLEAINECLDMDSYLVSIGTSDIDSFVRNTLIRNQLIGQQLWTSGQNTGRYTEWVWAGTGRRFRYTNWGTYYDEYSYYYSTSCLAIRAYGINEAQYKWEPASCDEEFNFICAKY